MIFLPYIIEIFIGLVFVITMIICFFYVFVVDLTDYHHFKYKDKRNFNSGTISTEDSLGVKYSVEKIDNSISRITTEFLLFTKGLGIPSIFSKNVGFNTVTFFLILFGLLSIGLCIEEVSDKFMDVHNYGHFNLKKTWLPSKLLSDDYPIEKLKDPEEFNLREWTKSIDIYTRNIDDRNKGFCAEECYHLDKDCRKDSASIRNILKSYHEIKTYIELNDDNYFKILSVSQIKINFFSSIALISIICILSVVFNLHSNCVKAVFLWCGGLYDPYLDKELEFMRKRKNFGIALILSFLILVLVLLIGLNGLYVFGFFFLAFLAMGIIYLVNKDINLLVLFSVQKGLMFRLALFFGIYLVSCQVWFENEKKYDYHVFNYGKILFNKEKKFMSNYPNFPLNTTQNDTLILQKRFWSNEN